MKIRFASHVRALAELCRLTACYMIVLLITLATTSANAQRRTRARARTSANVSAEDIAKKVLPSVVLIVCEDGKGNKSIGSGFFVRAQGELMIATAYHVIKGMVRGTWQIANQRNNSNVIASVHDYDEQSDLALLRLDLDPYEAVVPAAFDPRLRPLSLALGAPIRPGQTVYALGNPEGLMGTISQGIVSAAPRQFKDGTRIQISAPISPGSSGGPVVNSAGDVIGIAEFFSKEGQNLNFAVPVSLLSKLFNRIEIYLVRLPGLPLDPSLDAGDVNKQSNPTKPESTAEETANWLTQKLEGSSGVSRDGYLRVIVAHLYFAASNEFPRPYCTMHLTIRYDTDVSEFEYYSVPLSLAERAMAARNQEQRWGVWVLFSRNVPYKRSSEQPSGQRTDRVMLSAPDQELADRASKAFNHLIQLCGGGKKREPF